MEHQQLLGLELVAAGELHLDAVLAVFQHLGHGGLVRMSIPCLRNVERPSAWPPRLSSVGSMRSIELEHHDLGAKGGEYAGELAADDAASHDDEALRHVVERQCVRGGLTAGCEKSKVGSSAGSEPVAMIILSVSSTRSPPSVLASTFFSGVIDANPLTSSIPLAFSSWSMPPTRVSVTFCFLPGWQSSRALSR